MAIQIERSGARVYLTGDTFAIKDRIKAIGGHWDGDRRAWWVGSAKATEAEALINGNSEQASPQQRSADEVRLTGKGTYQGRSYYLGSRTQDGQRVLILGLPKPDGTYFSRWVPVAEVTVTKTYESRQVWDGRHRSGRTIEKHQTLGSIARFIEREQGNRQAGGDVCVECGKSGDLVRDLEDGAMKHRHCCDIEP